jgi:hypothetical protein
LIGSSKRTYTNTGISNFTIQGYGLKKEVYDSIPYQRTSFNDPDYPDHNYVEPALLNNLNYFRDTLLGEEPTIMIFRCRVVVASQEFSTTPKSEELKSF